MRTSLVVASLIAAPVLLITACGANIPAHVIKGTVIEKEYEPSKKKTKRVAVKERVCTTPKAKKNGKKLRATCTSRSTGKYTNSTTITKACYEIDIRLADGTETEVCDKYAYYVLIPGDHYSSAVDYSKKKRAR